MVDNPSFDEYAQLVAQVFNADPAKIRRSTQARDVTGWDSISHALLIMKIEESFGVEFSDEEIYTLPDVGALYDRTMERMNG